MTHVLLNGSKDFLTSLPEWTWAIILGAIVSILVFLIINQEFRDVVGGAVSRVIDKVQTQFTDIFDAIEHVWKAIMEGLIMIWNLAAPIIVPEAIAIAGVASETIAGLLRQLRGDFTDLTSNSNCPHVDQR